MKITISGTAGSGKNITGELLAKELGYKYYDIGGVRREMAKSRGMSLAEFNQLGEKESFTDKDADKFAEKIGKENPDLVMTGRLAFHFIPDSIKIFLDADLKVRADRIHRSFRSEENFSSLVDAMRVITEREISDRRRYSDIYGINCYHHGHYDIVVDTTNKSPEEAVREIMSFIKNKDNDFIKKHVDACKTKEEVNVWKEED